MFTLVLPDETLQIISEISKKTGWSYADIISKGINEIKEKVDNPTKKQSNTKATIRFGRPENK